MMKGYNVIGKRISAQNEKTIKAISPKTLKELDGNFHIATLEEAEEAVQKAKKAAPLFAAMSGSRRALFLRTIADNIEELATTLVERVMAESGLPEGRVVGERGRTCGQLRFFANKIEEGSWVNAIIDTADGKRVPPKPDIRQYQEAIGPVVVFTASNFPLAFSTAGGDTASALAAGCPVIVKAHESHLGTNNYIAEAIQAAAIETGMPDGVFSSLNGQGFELGTFLVKHPDVSAVAFTGSYSGGKALYDMAQSRKLPIPVFSEMGSVNPVFILPGAMESGTESWAMAISGSVNLGAGQFCTNPGILVALKNEYYLAFKDQLVEAFGAQESATMLNQGIYKNFEAKKHEKLKQSGVSITYIQMDNDQESLLGHPCLLEVSASSFLKNPGLAEEVFGPFSIMVVCDNKEEMMEVTGAFEGQLTFSFLGNEDEINDYGDLINQAKMKAGRIIFNALPTGVEVCEAMNHGGPYPATTDVRFTSVGGNAIYRFSRPVCYQGFPDGLLPDALKKANPLKIWRKVDGVLGKE